jgi:hypothetical protein
MIDIDLHPTDRVLRQFAGAWLVICCGLGLHRWFVHGNGRAALALVAVAIVIGGAGLLRPKTVQWIFVACTVAAFPIGWVVSQVMLLVLFAGVITPVALLFKLRGRDRLSRTRMPGQQSYWKPKVTVQDIRRYLRQY